LLRTDFSMHAASRETLGREMSFMRALEDFEREACLRETIQRRRRMVHDIKWCLLAAERYESLVCIPHFSIRLN